MKRFKRLAALFMAVAMLMTCAATTAVAAEKDVWVDFDWDAPMKREVTYSINSTATSVTRPSSLLSSAKPMSIAIENTPNKFGATFSILDIEPSEQADGKWLTQFRVKCDMDFSQLTPEDVGTEFSTSLTVTLANGGSKSFDYVNVIDDRPMFGLADASHKMIRHGLEVGKSFVLMAEARDKAGILEGKTVTYTWSIQSGTSVAKVEDHGETATLTTLAPGKATLSIKGVADGLHPMISSYPLTVGSTPIKPPVTDSGDVRDSGDSSEDDSNSPESLRLVSEQATWNKTFAALASEDSLLALPSGTAVVNGQTVTAPLLTFNTDEVKQIPAFVVDRLAGKNALLKFTGKDITDSFIHGAAVQPTAGNRIFYRVADFLALYAPQE